MNNMKLLLKITLSLLTATSFSNPSKALDDKEMKEKTVTLTTVEYKKSLPEQEEILKEKAEKKKKLEVVRGILKTPNLPPSLRGKYSNEVVDLTETPDDQFYLDAQFFNEFLEISEHLIKNHHLEDAYQQYYLTLQFPMPFSQREKINKAILHSIKTVDAKTEFSILVNSCLKMQQTGEEKGVIEYLKKDIATQYAMYMHYASNLIIDDGRMKLLTYDFSPEDKELHIRIQECLDKINPLEILYEKNPGNKFNKIFNIMFKILRKVKKDTPEDEFIYDALVKFYDQLLSQKNIPAANTFIKKLYEEPNASPMVKNLYTSLLLPQIKGPQNSQQILTAQIIKNLTEIIDRPRYQTAENYNNLGICFVKQKKYNEAIKYLSKALEKTPTDSQTTSHLGMIYILNNQYAEAITQLKKALTLPYPNEKQIKNSLLLAYYHANEPAEVSNLIEERTNAALEKYRNLREKMAQAVKTQQQIRQQELEIKQIEKKSREQKQAQWDKLREEKIKKLQNQNPLPSQVSDNLLDDLPPIIDQDSPASSKPKVKTKGIANISMSKKPSVPAKKALVEEKVEELPTLEDLLQCKQNYEIVQEMFEAFTNQLNSASLKISFERLESIWEELGGYYDRSQGKGSHTKLTIKELDGEEQMMILSNKTYLTKAQITNLVEVFLKLGLYPNDEKIKEILTKRGWNLD